MNSFSGVTHSVCLEVLVCVSEIQKTKKIGRFTTKRNVNYTHGCGLFVNLSEIQKTKKVIDSLIFGFSPSCVNVWTGFLGKNYGIPTENFIEMMIYLQLNIQMN